MAVHLLLIDDSDDQAVITRRSLERNDEEFVVDVAVDGAAGLQKILAGGHDVVLCDYRLPDMSGIDVLQHIKEQGIDIPFIIVTSVGNERVAVEALQAGADDYLVKDAVSEKMLAQVLLKSIEAHQTKREKLELEIVRQQMLKDLQDEKARLEVLNRLMVDRELNMVQLKREIDHLLKELGRPPKFGNTDE